LLNFVLGGPLLILGAILLVMFNADAWTWGISRLLGGIGVLTPVLKTAIAYPLSSRFRTGMAMLLFAMIISTVTLMTVVIQATQSLVAPDSERYAGFEVGVYNGLLSFFDPLEDLAAELPNKEGFPVEDVAAVGSVTPLRASVRQTTPSDAILPLDMNADLRGVNEGYLVQAENVYTFKLRSPEYADDAAVWEALRTRNDVAVVTADLIASPERAARLAERAAGGNPPGLRDDPDNDPEGEDWNPNLWILGVPENATTLPVIQLEVENQQDPNGPPTTHTIQVIAVVDQSTTLAGSGLWVNQAAVNTLAGEVVNPNEFYVKVRDGADVRMVAQELERAFLNNAVNATVLAESFAQAQALTRGILQLFQGFLALGLLVGIAALGVISFRTVVERRQQVGMLRAIGFQPRMVALSFLLESSFIALTGIAVGAFVGTLLGDALVAGSFDAITDGRSFALPWGQIGGIVLAAYGFSLLTTVLPALQASRIYPAEALRYE
jgi:putative ABC transport system permease protein